MALIKCIECGKEISDKAKTCPNCGYKIPPPEMKKIDKIFIPIITILFFLGFFGVCLSPMLVKHTYPNRKTYTTYDTNGLVGFDSNGNEIRGHTSTNHYYLGEMETDYSTANAVAGLSILVPSATLVTYLILKKKDKTKENKE